MWFILSVIRQEIFFCLKIIKIFYSVISRKPICLTFYMQIFNNKPGINYEGCEVPFTSGGQDLFIPFGYSVDTVPFLEKEHLFSRVTLHQLCHKSSVIVCMVYFYTLFHSIVLFADIFSNSKFNFIMSLIIQWLNFPILIFFSIVLFIVYLLHICANFGISLSISTFKKLQGVLGRDGMEGIH